MSKTTKVTYGVSVMMGEHWEKIDIEETPDKGDTMESILDDLNSRLRIWHEKKHPAMYQKRDKAILADVPTVATDDPEWEEIKKKLSDFKFQEEAQAFINSTPYRMVIEAKKIINQKPLHNEK